MINPKWTAHNDLYNEGQEGYNPHMKHIAAVAVADSGARMIAGKRRTHDEAIRFAKNCLSGAARDAFVAQIHGAYPERYQN